MPFAELKVDKGFVRSMVQTCDSRRFIAAFVGRGQSRCLTTVAEGVESHEQGELLLWLACDTGQGWLFGRAGSGGKPFHPCVCSPAEGRHRYRFPVEEPVGRRHGRAGSAATSATAGGLRWSPGRPGFVDRGSINVKA